VPEPSLFELLRPGEWPMLPGERAALEGILAVVRPSLSIEIGTSAGGSLASISRYSGAVHSFDLVRHPSLTEARFPNVAFHTGDSHELLPRTLAELEASGANVDFAFVDGDHSAAGVRRDVEDLLGSAAAGRTVILIHDTFNERVRAGLDAIDFATFADVRFVDLDFVPGRATHGGAAWAGLGLVVVGLEVEADVPPPLRSVDASAAMWAVEEELARQRELVQHMERSLSWRLTAPLRRVRSRLRR
jgi:Methyltransferase domain